MGNSASSSNELSAADASTPPTPPAPQTTPTISPSEQTSSSSLLILPSPSTSSEKTNVEIALELEYKRKWLDANHYWKKACENNEDLTGMSEWRMGNRYWWGLGVPVDKTKAEDLWVMSALKGHKGGQARCCSATLADYKKAEPRAFQLYQELAKAVDADVDAQCILAESYETGTGVEKDVKQALEWYRHAAERQHGRAQFYLGKCYETGNGVAKDEKQAVEWYFRAAEQEDPDAQLNLGLCYEFGCVVEKDEQQAVKWYSRAAEQGEPSAQFILGVRYANGNGVEKDEKEAVRWYRRAAQQGKTSAQFNLGQCYANGNGVKKDEQQAVKWYRRAASQGYSRARTILGEDLPFQGSVQIGNDFTCSMNYDDELGSGTFGRVFKAKLPPTVYVYNAAFKRLQKNVSETGKKYFLEEIELLKAAKHKNILRLLGICAEPLGFLSELCDRSLKNCISKLTNRDKIFIAKEVAEGLAYLHSKQVIKDEAGQDVVVKNRILHRDLKSENILLKDGFKVVKIADFGLGTTISTSSLATTLNIGTPTYQAPELIQSPLDEENAAYDEKCDVYSYAMILYEILSEMTPFESERREKKLNAINYGIKKGKRPRLDAIDDDDPFIIQLIEIMKQCWADDPKMRPNMEAVMKDIGLIYEKLCSSSSSSSSSSASTSILSTDCVSTTESTPDMR